MQVCVLYTQIVSHCKNENLYKSEYYLKYGNLIQPHVNNDLNLQFTPLRYRQITYSTRQPLQY